MKPWFPLAAVLAALVLAAPAVLAAPPSTRTLGESAVAAPSPEPESPAPETAAPSPEPESPAPSTSPAAEPSGPACPTTPTGPTPSQPLGIPEDVRLALFQAIWQAIDQNYVDPDHNGVDWAGTKTTYQPEIVVVDNADQIYSLLATMVSSLDDPYTAYLTPAQVQAATSGSVTYGGIGTLLDPTDTAGPGVRVLFVFPGGPADQAGLRSRDRILAVNGDPCVSIDKIRGDVGSSVTLTIQSPSGKPHDIEIQRGQIAGVIPPQSDRLNRRNNIGYLRMASMSGQGTAVEDTLRAFTSKNPIDGLIIDLRGTTLGGTGSLTDLLGQFVQGQVGSFYSRSQSAAFNVDPLELAKPLAKIPIVVLVDSRTSGEAEQFAAILQSQKRATVIGQQTRGRSDLAQPVDFPDGSRLIVVTAGLQLPDGSKLQDHGVTPDVKVNADWLAVPERDDPYIKAALRALQ
jgi:carboxyl-terminal processing protease